MEKPLYNGKKLDITHYEYLIKERFSKDEHKKVMKTKKLMDKIGYWDFLDKVCAAYILLLNEMSENPGNEEEIEVIKEVICKINEQQHILYGYANYCNKS